jgi:hypothetical protein
MNILIGDTFKKMFADLGAKVIGLPLVDGLKGRVLWINFHFAHRIDFKLLPGWIISLHIDNTIANYGLAEG